MKRHKYALGLWNMLALARHEHDKKHGCPPVRFEMHPANWCELRMDEKMKYVQMTATGAEMENSFMGVPVVIDRLAYRLKMITADNTVEYL